MDADFNGENGEDYLWDDAKDNGFDSNLDYSLFNDVYILFFIKIINI